MKRRSFIKRALSSTAGVVGLCVVESTVELEEYRQAARDLVPEGFRRALNDASVKRIEQCITEPIPILQDADWVTHGDYLCYQVESEGNIGKQSF